MTISPSKFLRELLSIVVPAPGQAIPVAWITTFEGDPREAPNSCWTGRAYDPAKPLPRINGECAYYSVAAFPAGTSARRQTTNHAVLAIVCDDIGTKVKTETVISTLGEPSFVIETSPGNFQYGYLPDKPIDSNKIKSFEFALKTLGATDQAGGSSVRYVRLPAGIDGKAGSKFAVRLVEWHPERRYALTYFQERLKVDSSVETAARDLKTDLELLAAFEAGTGRYDPMMSLSGRWAQRGASRDDIESNFYTLLDKCPSGNYQELRRQVPHIAWTAVKKFGDPRVDAGSEPWNPPHDFLHAAAARPFDATDVPACMGEFATNWARHAGFDATGLIAACVVTAAAALHDGIKLTVQQETAWCESARLWASIFAPPGFAKTPMIRAATAPLQSLHKARLDLYATQFEDWKVLQPQPGVKGPSTVSDPPPRPALFTNDCTIEKLSEILSDNEGGVMYLAEELDSWLGSHDAYRSGGGSRDRGEWLQLFDGGPHQVDRVKRGSFHVQNWGVSLLAATTPAALQKMAHKLGNDGLLQRILPFMITAAPAPDHTVQVEDSATRYHEVIGRINDYQPSLIGDPDPVILEKDARALLDAEIDRYRNLAPACGAISEGLAGHVAKYGSILARLTLTFHAVECADKRLAGPACAPISASTVGLAAKFLRKAFTHARALYRDLSGNDTAFNVAQRVALGLVADGLKQTDGQALTIDRRTLVQRYEVFRKAEEYVKRDAMQLLVDFGWCRPTQSKYDKGHPTCWDINPATFETYRKDGEDWLQRRAFVKEAIIGGKDGGP